MKFQKIPGLVAIPFTSTSICSSPHLADNVLFEEDFASPETLFKSLQEKIIWHRQADPLSCEPPIPNLVIAGLFGMTYTSMRMPMRSLNEASETLYLQTLQQADTFCQQNTARRTITGPAGTGEQ